MLCESVVVVELKVFLEKDGFCWFGDFGSSCLCVVCCICYGKVIGVCRYVVEWVVCNVVCLVVVVRG